MIWMRLSGRKRSSYTRNWTQRQRIVLLALIGANFGVFFAQLVVEAYQPGFVLAYLGLSDAGVRDAYAWQFLTAMFLHSGPWHLLGNVVILYFLGRDLESILGSRHFLYLYLCGSIAGELGHLFLMPSNSVLYGASGGVAAVVVAYATILPELELTALVFFVVPIRLRRSTWLTVRLELASSFFVSTATAESFTAHVSAVVWPAGFMLICLVLAALLFCSASSTSGKWRSNVLTR